MLYGQIVTGPAFKLLQSVYASTCDKSLGKVDASARNLLKTPLKRNRFLVFLRGWAVAALKYP
jgi:hypothetical protein